MGDKHLPLFSLFLSYSLSLFLSYSFSLYLSLSLILECSFVSIPISSLRSEEQSGNTRTWTLNYITLFFSCHDAKRERKEEEEEEKERESFDQELNQSCLSLIPMQFNVTQKNIIPINPSTQSSSLLSSSLPSFSSFLPHSHRWRSKEEDRIIQVDHFLSWSTIHPNHCSMRERADASLFFLFLFFLSLALSPIFSRKRGGQREEREKM